MTAAQRLAAAWLRATHSLGYALTTREMAQHWDQFGDGPRPTPLSNTAQNLAKNGTLVCVVSRIGRRRYAHRDHPSVLVEPPATGHFEAGVRAALHDAASAAGRYVTTREVTAAMLAGGYVSRLGPGDKTRIQQILSQLAIPDQRRTASDVPLPGPVTLATVRRITGHDAKRSHVHWWRPTALHLPEPHPETPATQREAATRAVETVRAALGRPATTEEVALYLAARRTTDPDDPVVLSLGDEKGLGPAIQAARGWIDRSTEKGASGFPKTGLVRVRTPFTAGRLLPPRLALAPVTPEETARCVATDLLFRLRPAQESAHLEWLAGQPGGTDPVLRDLAVLRRAILAQEVALALPPETWPDVLVHLRDSLRTLEGWINALQGRTRWSGLPRRFRRILGSREQDVAALGEFLAADVTTALPARFSNLPTPAVIGTVATMASVDVGPLHDGLVALVGSTTLAYHPALRRARRVPPPPGAAKTRATPMAVDVAAEHLDRVDAFATAIDHVGLPTAVTLVGDAVGLLGPVLRDARIMECVLDALPPRHGWARRGALVALGLLGSAPSPALWLTDPEDAHAGALATVLADSGTASATLRRLLSPELPARTRQVLLHAITQIDAGEWLAAVD